MIYCNISETTVFHSSAGTEPALGARQNCDQRAIRKRLTWFLGTKSLGNRKHCYKYNKMDCPSAQVHTNTHQNINLKTYNQSPTSLLMPQQILDEDALLTTTENVEPKKKKQLHQWLSIYLLAKLDSANGSILKCLFEIFLARVMMPVSTQ